MKRRNHNWTEREIGKLKFAYSTGGMAQARKDLPHLTPSQITSRATKLGLKAPRARISAMTYGHLEPLAPENEHPGDHDAQRVIHYPVGSWKADVPAVRWVFDLGVAA